MKVIENINKVKVDNLTVETLEELLEKAKSGELKSIMFVDSYRDGTVGHGWAGTPDHKMIGKLREVEFDFFSQMYFPMIEE